MATEKNSKTWVSKLFLIWLITMIFGANLLPINLPGFTLYLNLLLGIGLFLIFIIDLKIKAIVDHLKYVLPIYILLALGGWSIYAAEGETEAIYAFRALMVFSLTVSNLALAFVYFGKKALYSYLILGLWNYLGVCLIFGFFEFFTGIHFAGNFTDKLIDLPVSLITYAPTFLWDNPNTYIAYISIIGASLLIIDKSIQLSIWKQLVLCLPIFFFSIVGQSLFGLIIAGIIGVLIVSAQLSNILKSLKSSLVLLVAAVLFMLITIVMNDMFLGPKWKDGEKYRLNSLTAVEVIGDDINVIPLDSLLNQVEEDTIIKRLHDNVYSSMSSFSLRKNLILNGLDYWKEKPILGLGAGQYSFYNAHGRNPRPVEKLLNPHNLGIEILSQFGVFGILFLFGLLVGFIRLLKKARDKVRIIVVLGTALIFILASSLPSSLLIYDCLWLFVGVLIIEAFLVKGDAELNEQS